jgi:hypothetical protein
MDNVDLPNSLFFNDELKDKFGAKLQSHQIQVLRFREQQTKIE